MTGSAAIIAAAMSAGAAPPAGITYGALLGVQKTDAAATTIVISPTLVDAPIGSTAFSYVSSHSATEPSMADSEGNTWAGCGASINQGGRKRLFETTLSNQLDAGATITGTVGSSRSEMIAWYVTGLLGGSLDTRHATGTTGTSTTPSVTSPTLAATDKILFGTLELGSGGLIADITEASGWTTIGSVQGALWVLHAAYKLVSAANTAAETYAPTLANSRAWVADIVSRKAA